MGDHLRKRRLELGLQQKDVAKKLGANVTSVLNWERNKRKTELRFLPAIYDFVGYVPEFRAETIAERLVAFRRGRGWSQKQFARALRVDPTTLSRWETGKKTPTGVYRVRVRATLDL
ncbi:MAG: transcriptional regulator [Opitutae bacterium]|nr:transcriptional regulator [Opitutae bacterium]